MSVFVEGHLTVVRFIATAVPKIWQSDVTGSGAAGATMLVQAQSASGASSTGGTLDLRSGTGTSAAGAITIRCGSSIRFEVSSVGLGFYGVAPVARPAAYVQNYTTASRTLASYSPPTQSIGFTGINNAQVGAVYAKLEDLEELRDSFETLRLHHESVAKALNSVIDDLQALGLLQ